MALQDASIALVPMILTVTILLMISEGLIFFNTLHSIAVAISNIYTYFYIFFPLIFTVSLSMAFAKSKDIDATCLVLICFSLLFLTLAHRFETFLELRESTYIKLLPIPLCFFTSIILKYFSSKSRLHIFKTDDISLNINKSFNYILPSIFTFCLVFLLVIIGENIWQSLADYQSSNPFIITDTSNLSSVFFFKLINKLIWFIGVNPSHIFSFLGSVYHDAFLENVEAFSLLQTVPNINVSGNYIFTDIGGAGSVFCLLIAILLFSKSLRHQRLAKVSILPSTFNISEILHYGMPIVFNPFLFVPFVFVPIILYLNTYLFMSLGLVNPVVASIPWTTPPLLNAYLATGGDFFAILLQVINLYIGTAIYLKFLRMLESSHLDNDVVSDFSKKFNLETQNIQALQFRNQQSLMKNLEIENQINSYLSLISKGDLVLYYQPILNAKTKKIAKVEALIRIRDESGKIFPPDFINLFSEVGLSTHIDRWVVNRAVKQSHDWPSKFDDIQISINISPNSLLDRDFVEFLIKMHQKSIHSLSIEILENQAVFEEQKINDHLKLLKDQNITVFLDDFGSGFSALSMLSKLNIDGVKYDIDFTRQLHTNDGFNLLNSCLNISKTLNHITVLEGIETEEQLELALKSDVDYIQGFFIAIPLVNDELETFIDTIKI